MSYFFRRSGDDVEFIVGTLSRVSAKRVSELTDSSFCVVATRPTAWLSHCLGVPHELYV